MLKRLIGGLKNLKLFPLSCAGVLCAWPLQYVHPTCLWCRHRRQWLKKWVPGKMIRYWLPWTHTVEWATLPMIKLARRQQEVAPEYIFIDKRGHFLMLRCSMVVTFLKVANLVYRAVRRIKSAKAQYRAFNMLMMFPWQNLAECVAAIIL